MIKLKYTTYVKILVIIVVKNKELIKSLPKEVRFQKALKNPSTPPPRPPSHHVGGMNLLVRPRVKIN